MKKTVTVGITAYNEATTIVHTLQCVLNQQAKNYFLEKIVVISDGSTDGTPEAIAKEFKTSQVQVIKGQINKGKATRLKELFTMNVSDVLVILDADVHIEDKSFISKLISGFTTAHVGIVSSNNQPVKPSSLIGRIWYANENIWYHTRKDYLNGINLYNNSGCGVALEKNFAKSIEIPKNAIADQQFIYISSVIRHKKFVFKDKAIVYYWPPSTFEDICIQFTRSLGETSFLESVYGQKFKDLFKVSLPQKIKGILRSFLSNPVFTVLSVLLLKYLQYVKPVTTDQPTQNGLWLPTKSTKKLIEL